MQTTEPSQFSNFSDDELKEELFTEKLPKLLSVISSYGSFKYNDLEVIKIKSLEEIKSDKIIPRKEIIVLIGFMLDEGFAIERTDISPNSIQLTDKGRELKRLGSIREFKNQYAEKKAKLNAIENDRLEMIQRNKIQFQLNKRQFFINVCIAIATVLAAVYYFFELLRVQYHLGLPGHVFFS